MDRIDEKIEQGNLKRQLRKFWPEVQRYSGLDYAFDRRVLLQTSVVNMIGFMFGMALYGAAMLVIASIFLAQEGHNLAAVICVVACIVCIALSVVAFRANTSVDKIWTLSYPCQKAKFLKRRLASVKRWQEETKPLLDKFLKLRPVIVDELGLEFVLFGYDNLKDFYVVCDLLEGDSLRHSCTQDRYEDLVRRIIREREKRKRDKLSPEQRRCEAQHIIEEFEAKLK